MTFPRDCHSGTVAQVARAIRRRAVAFAALQEGVSKDEAAQRVGITRNALNRYLRQGWRPGA
jgi:transposase